MEGRKAPPIDLSKTLVGLDDEDLTKYDADSIRKKVIARVQKMGLTMQPQPMRDGQPLIPIIDAGKISGISNMDLTNKRGEYVAVFAYAAEMRVLADAMAEAYEEQAEFVKNKVFLVAQGNIEERKAVARTNPRYVTLKEKLLEWKATAALLAAKCGSLEGASAVLSRDVEFRKEERAQTVRNHNIEQQRRRVFRGSKR